MSIVTGFFSGRGLPGEFRGRTFLLTASSHPRIRPIVDRLEGPAAALGAACVDALTSEFGLDGADDLGTRVRAYRGEKSRSLDYVVADSGTVWACRLVLEWASPGRLSVKVNLRRSRDSDPAAFGDLQDSAARGRVLTEAAAAGMEEVLERPLVLGPGEPAVLGVSRGDRALFMMIGWTPGAPVADGTDRRVRPGVPPPAAPRSPALAMVAPPRILEKVTPAYPEELRRRNVRGEVKVRLSIDPSGRVTDTAVEKPLHPYLDYSAAAAFRRWAFEPVLRDGKAVAVATVLGWVFDPLAYAMAEQAEVPEYDAAADEADPELERLLDRAAASAKALRDSAPDFVCEESIDETHRYLDFWDKPQFQVLEERGYGSGANGTKLRMWSWARYRVNFGTRVERNRVVSDYQWARQDGVPRERRIVLKRNGRKVNADDPRVGVEPRFSALRPIFAADRILAPERRRLFSFRRAGTERAAGIRTEVVEVRPRAGLADQVEAAKIWIEPEGGQVVRLEIRGVPLEGWEDVWTDAVRFREAPAGRAVHRYDMVRKGIRYPSRSTFEVEYPLPDPPGPLRKVSMEMAYRKYRFFSVETRHEIVREPAAGWDQVMSSSSGLTPSGEERWGKLPSRFTAGGH